MSVDCRVLIKQVQARPALWNRGHKNYCQKRVISKLWEELALIHGVHASIVKNKWKGLRDTFRQELKKKQRTRTWNYYLDMQFIKGQLKQTGKQQANKPGFEDRLDETLLVKMEPEESNSNYQEDFKSGRSEEGDEGGWESIDVDHEEDGHQRTFNVYVDDDDYHFLMSLLPEMRKLKPEKKMLLRIKMMELFCKEAYQQE